MTTRIRTGAQIDRMSGSEVDAMLGRLAPEEWRSMLVYLSGYNSEAFECALRNPEGSGHVCGLQADDDNWCILPKDHTESHDAGEFTWDTQAELHTIAAT